MTTTGKPDWIPPRCTKTLPNGSQCVRSLNHKGDCIPPRNYRR